MRVWRRYQGVVRTFVVVGALGVTWIDANISGASLYTFLYLPLFLIANPWLTFFAVCCGAVQIYLLPILPNRSFDTNLMRVIGPVACVLAYRGSLLAKSAGPLGMRVVERYGPNIRAAVFAGLVLAAAAFMSRAVSVEKNLWWCLVGVLLMRALPKPSSSPPLKVRVLNGALLFFSTLTALGLLELGVRIALPEPRIPPMPGDGVLVHHPEAFYTLAPGKSHDYWVDSDWDGSRRYFTVDVSSQGLRGRAAPAKKPDELRILVLGDSITMGWGVDDASTIPVFMQRILSERLNRPVTVLNGGVIGYGPWQERIFLTERCLALKPDLVLLQLFPENDIENTLFREGVYPEAYHREWVKIALPWRFKSDWRMLAERRISHMFHSYYYMKRLAGARWTALDVINGTRFVERVRMPELPESAPRPEYLEIFLADWYPMLHDGWAQMTNDVAGIQDDCAVNGIDLAGFAVPLYHNFYGALWEKARAAAPDHEYEKMKDVRLARQLFDDLGIPYVDVAGPIESALDLEPYYIPDGHLRENGCRIVAEALSNYVAGYVADNPQSVGE